jgi:peptidyl-prolyl cis-trans isomerase A (cyclophilin A)/peptidyl-prolyl cis-trans isomerase B (cyclophilin B)
MDARRRAVVCGVGTASATLLAGCLGGGDGEPGAPDDSGAGDESRQSFATPGRPSGMSDNPTVTFETNRGEFTAELFADRAPRTVENFLGLARHDPAADADPAPDTNTWEDPESGEVRGDSLYEGAVFHRVIEDFMIQGGDPTGTGRGGPGYEFDDEFHDELRHDEAGKLSMANSGPDTNGSQFFVTLDAQPHLDDRHAVFGQVIDGMDVVREIGDVPTDGNDAPTEDVRIESVDVDE